jgi:hypothetical protein
MGLVDFGKPLLFAFVPARTRGNEMMYLRTLAWASTMVVATLQVLTAAQWLDQRESGIPRTRDGKPNLTAPPPKAPGGKPYLSGIWVAEWPGPADEEVGPKISYYLPPGVAIPFQPWAEALYRERSQKFGAGRPAERCLPHGIPDAMLVPGPFKFIQTAKLTILLYEEFNHYRQIFTDGRGHPQDPQPTWFGYSVGKWDRDTFVVDTVGFNDKSWMDDYGLPHTEALHTTERFRRRDFGHMDVDITVDDPKAYTKHWSLAAHFTLLADTELLEDVCDNEKDASRLHPK